jgi:hypothetical protein
MTQLQICSSPSDSSVAAAESEIPQAEPQNLQPESENLNNQALDRCIKAWSRTFDLASINPKDETLDVLDENDTLFAREQGALAFRSAMPLLVGYDNIRDFIACTTYAMLMEIFSRDDSRELLGAAKVAMALLRAQPKL